MLKGYINQLRSFMMQNFTLLKLISYLYGESSEEESIDITNLILGDEHLYEELESLSKVKDLLDSFSLSPQESSSEKILDYSKLALA